MQYGGASHVGLEKLHARKCTPAPMHAHSHAPAHTRTHTHTQTETNNTYCFSMTTVVIRKRLNVTSYVQGGSNMTGTIRV